MRLRLTNLALLASLAPIVGACSGATDLLSKDAEWFSRPGRVFAPRTVSLDTGPLSPSGPVGPNDLVNADGVCAASVATDANAAVESRGGGYALGNTECDLVRVAGLPDSVSVNGDGGNRDVTVTYLRGARPGVYRFTAGRLTSIEKSPEAPAPERPAKRPSKAKRAT